MYKNSAHTLAEASESFTASILSRSVRKSPLISETSDWMCPTFDSSFAYRRLHHFHGRAVFLLGRGIVRHPYLGGIVHLKVGARFAFPNLEREAGAQVEQVVLNGNKRVLRPHS